MDLKTSRLLLRPARPDDLTALHAILADPNATAYWSTPPHADLAQTQAWLQSMLEILPGEGEDFIIEIEGEVAGKAGFYRFPEIGFILHPRFWGRGIAREAISAVLDRGFAVHALPQAVADVDPRNARSLRALQALGFREVGRRFGSWQVGDELCDSVDLALAAKDWRRPS